MSDVSFYYFKITPLVLRDNELIVDFDIKTNLNLGGYPCLGTYETVASAIQDGSKEVKKFFKSKTGAVDHADALRLEIFIAKDNVCACNVLFFRGIPICDYCGNILFSYENSNKIKCLSCNRKLEIVDALT